MGFEQDLRAYLEGVERETATKVASVSRQVDEHELHRHFLLRMRELERTTHALTVRRLFDEWPDRLPGLARHVEQLPAQVAPSDRDGAQAFASGVLDLALDLDTPAIGLVDQLELRRIAETFLREGSLAADYALEGMLVRRTGGQPTLTELGRVFVRLRGRDAVRWLITSELLQSTGASDPWHASRWLLEAVQRPEGLVVDFAGDDESSSGFLTVLRLEELGLLVDLEADAHEVGRYRLVPELRDVVHAALEPGPWHIAIRALLDDERAVIVPGSYVSSDTTVEQTKLIAHEVRNALIPVRHDLVALRTAMQEPAHQERVANAQNGVLRVLKFVEEMVETSELITEPMLRCELDVIVEQALGWVDSTRRVQHDPAFGSMPVMAPRNRLARAISNVVGNALQATGRGQPVRVEVQQVGSSYRIIVDDGGPGVPREHRQRVFLEGVTMRGDGTGSGFGLAFARRVVEGTLHGRIWCEDSDLGGARFVIELPVPSPV